MNVIFTVALVLLHHILVLVQRPVCFMRDLKYICIYLLFHHEAFFKVCCPRLCRGFLVNFTMSPFAYRAWSCHCWLARLGHVTDKCADKSRSLRRLHAASAAVHALAPAITSPDSRWTSRQQRGVIGTVDGWLGLWPIHATAVPHHNRKPRNFHVGCMYCCKISWNFFIFQSEIVFRASRYMPV